MTPKHPKVVVGGLPPSVRRGRRAVVSQPRLDFLIAHPNEWVEFGDFSSIVSARQRAYLFKQWCGAKGYVIETVVNKTTLYAKLNPTYKDPK